MSAKMVFLGRRTRGPEGGNSQGLPARVHAEHGFLLSHRIFLLLQPRHERGADRLAEDAAVAVGVICRAKTRSVPASKTGAGLGDAVFMFCILRGIQHPNACMTVPDPVLVL